MAPARRRLVRRAQAWAEGTDATIVQRYLVTADEPAALRLQFGGRLDRPTYAEITPGGPIPPALPPQTVEIAGATLQVRTPVGDAGPGGRIAVTSSELSVGAWAATDDGFVLQVSWADPVAAVPLLVAVTMTCDRRLPRGRTARDHGQRPSRARLVRPGRHRGGSSAVHLGLHRARDRRGRVLHPDRPPAAPTVLDPRRLLPGGTAACRRRGAARRRGRGRAAPHVVVALGSGPRRCLAPRPPELGCGQGHRLSGGPAALPAAGAGRLPAYDGWLARLRPRGLGAAGPAGVARPAPRHGNGLVPGEENPRTTLRSSRTYCRASCCSSTSRGGSPSSTTNWARRTSGWVRTRNTPSTSSVRRSPATGPSDSSGPTRPTGSAVTGSTTMRTTCPLPSPPCGGCAAPTTRNGERR